MNDKLLYKSIINELSSMLNAYYQDASRNNGELVVLISPSQLDDIDYETCFNYDMFSNKLRQLLARTWNTIETDILCDYEDEFKDMMYEDFHNRASKYVYKIMGMPEQYEHYRDEIMKNNIFKVIWSTYMKVICED